LLRKFVISSRFLFNKNHLSKEWDVFGCFTVPDFEPNELFPMDPSGTKKYTEEDEDGSAGAAAAAATAAAKVTIGKKIVTGVCCGPCNPSKWEADI
jgi:hypothetical protein